MNPKNAPAGVTATATAGAAAAAAAATAVPLGAPATAAAPTAAEVATGPVDLDEGDERAIGVLQRLNTAPVTTAAAVAAPGDGGRGRGRGRGQGQDRARLHSRQYLRRMYTCYAYRCFISPYSPYTRTMALQLCAVSRSLEMCIEIDLRPIVDRTFRTEAGFRCTSPKIAR